MLELINTNICGPFSIAYWNDQQYFTIFIDDYLRYGYLYFIHEKSQSQDVFEVFKFKLKINLAIKLRL